MKIYQLVENITNDNTAGSKAVIDIIEVANELGFKKLYIKNCERQNNFFKKIYRQISFFWSGRKFIIKLMREMLFYYNIRFV